MSSLDDESVQMPTIHAEITLGEAFAYMYRSVVGLGRGHRVARTRE